MSQPGEPKPLEPHRGKPECDACEGTAGVDRALTDRAVLAVLTDRPAKIIDIAFRADAEAVIVDGARDARTVRLSLERLERDGRAKRIRYKGWILGTE